MTPAAKLRKVMAFVNSVPGLADRVIDWGERMQTSVTRGEKLYRETHWGRQGARKPHAVSYPDPAGEAVTVLGLLSRIAYLTRKGNDAELVEYDHPFEAPYPILAFTSEGGRNGLVIVREQGPRASRYTVNARGIVG